MAREADPRTATTRGSLGVADSVVIPRLNSWGLGKRTPKNRIRRTWCPGVRVAIRGRPYGPAGVFGGELGRSSLVPLPRSACYFRALCPPVLSRRWSGPRSTSPAAFGVLFRAFCPSAFRASGADLSRPLRPCPGEAGPNVRRGGSLASRHGRTFGPPPGLGISSTPLGRVPAIALVCWVTE